MLGTELELRLLNYRDTTPLRPARSTTSPYGGGAGMVLRVDVVAAALEAAYGGPPGHRVVALTPQGRQLDQELVEELAGEEHLTLLSARFEGFDERDRRAPRHGRGLDRALRPLRRRAARDGLVDAIARRLPGRARQRGVGLEESFSAELDGGLEYPHYTRPAEFRGWQRARGAALRRPRADRGVAPRAEPRKDRALRNPIDLLTHGLPRQWRIAIDWAVTILGAVAIVLAIKAYVVNPYRIPSSSMEPTLHCARPGSGCESRFSDRVLANRFIYHFRDPQARRDRRLQDAARRGGRVQQRRSGSGGRRSSSG